MVILTIAQDDPSYFVEEPRKASFATFGVATHANWDILLMSVRYW